MNSVAWKHRLRPPPPEPIDLTALADHDGDDADGDADDDGDARSAARYWRRHGFDTQAQMLFADAAVGALVVAPAQGSDGNRQASQDMLASVGVAVDASDGELRPRLSSTSDSLMELLETVNVNVNDPSGERPCHAVAAVDIATVASLMAEPTPASSRTRRLSETELEAMIE